MYRAQRRTRAGGTRLAPRTEKIVPYLFLAPFFVGFMFFWVYPFVYSFVLSFFRFRGYGEARFLGFQNYVNLFMYPDFWLSIRNTLFYFVAHFVPVTVVSFFLAFGLQRGVFRPGVTAVYKTILFFPRVMATAAVALVFQVLLATRSGVVNQLLGTAIPFLRDPALTRWSVVALVSWRAIGWFLVVYLAGLTTISNDVRDSATIDGANLLQRLIHVVIPIMKPIFAFAFIMDTIASLKIFTEPNVLFPGIIPPPQVQPMMNMLTRNIGAARFGMASAVGWILFVMALSISLGFGRLLRTKD